MPYLLGKSGSWEPRKLPESQNFAQRAGKFLGIEIHTPMNVVAGIANGFDDELRFDPFRSFGEQEHSGQIQQAVVRG